MKSKRMRWQKLLFHAKRFRWREIGQKLAFRAYSNTIFICVRRDLDVPFTAPEAKIPILVRPLVADDIPNVFGNTAALSRQDQSELYDRWHHWQADIPTCYVAVTRDGSPAYIQWLMCSEHNEKIHAFFNDLFPVLAPDEAFLENALTLKDFRGKGIMSAAMARIAEQGKAHGVRYVLTMVDQRNIAALKACKNAGFLPYQLRQERWFLFRRSVTFRKLPEGARYPFEGGETARERA